ncbi:unnamed protein product [Durusdinium trenchii]|uniref:SMP-LTD domain-containing protein n=1 Tax=Durusdinium trenchii TaxID=1381693 RepID=A0ABP0NFC1_9DINO
MATPNVYQPVGEPVRPPRQGFAEAWSEAARNLGPAVGILSAAAAFTFLVPAFLAMVNHLRPDHVDPRTTTAQPQIPLVDVTEAPQTTSLFDWEGWVKRALLLESPGPALQNAEKRRPRKICKAWTWRWVFESIKQRMPALPVSLGPQLPVHWARPVVEGARELEVQVQQLLAARAQVHVSSVPKGHALQVQAFVDLGWELTGRAWVDISIPCRLYPVGSRAVPVVVTVTSSSDQASRLVVMPSVVPPEGRTPGDVKSTMGALQKPLAQVRCDERRTTKVPRFRRRFAAVSPWRRFAAKGGKGGWEEGWGVAGFLGRALRTLAGATKKTARAVFARGHAAREDESRGE